MSETVLGSNITFSVFYFSYRNISESIKEIESLFEEEMKEVIPKDFVDIYNNQKKAKVLAEKIKNDLSTVVYITLCVITICLLGLAAFIFNSSYYKIAEIFAVIFSFYILIKVTNLISGILFISEHVASYEKLKKYYPQYFREV